MEACATLHELGVNGTSSTIRDERAYSAAVAGQDSWGSRRQIEVYRNASNATFSQGTINIHLTSDQGAVTDLPLR